jgi:hypothetical protein
MADQIDAAQEEHTKQEFAQFRIIFNDMAQIRAADFNHGARFARMAPDETAPSRELIHFSREHPPGEDLRNSRKFNAAIKDQENSVNLISLIEKGFSRLSVTSFPLGCEARDLRVAKRGKLRIWLRHGYSITISST